MGAIRSIAPTERPSYAKQKENALGDAERLSEPAWRFLLLDEPAILCVISAEGFIKEVDNVRDDVKE